MDFKIKEQYEMIGQGEIPTSPVQVGEWWVEPAHLYKGKIPPAIQQELFKFLTQGVGVQGFLIAEDMRVIEVKRELDLKKAEAKKKALETTEKALFLPFIGIGYGLLFIFSALCTYDPMLIAVLDDRRWICLGTWDE